MTILLNTPDAEDFQTVELQVEPLSLSDNPSAVIPPIPAEGGPCYRIHANSEQNGRVDATLPEGPWEEAWTAELRKGFVPEAVLHSGDRILVQAGVWQLFDMTGNPIREGRVVQSNVTLDPEAGFFYHMNKLGDLVGRSLEDGEETFALMPFLGEEFSRPLIRRIEDRLLLVGIERQLDPHGHKKAKRSLLEWVDLGDSDAVTPSGMLASAKNAGTLILPSTKTLVATSDSTVVAVAPDILYITTPESKIKRAFGGDINPVALSLGGNGVIYLVVREGDFLALWCLSEEGVLLRRYTVEEHIQRVLAPPLIGFDGSIYLLTPRRIIALNADTTPRWESKTNTTFVGGTITRAGNLVVTCDDAIGYYDGKGEYHPVAEKAETPYCTTPAVTNTGEIAVASRRQLHLFRAVRK